jgi:signal transduction histidine kinase
MSDTAHVPAGNEWAMPHFRAIRTLRFAAMGFSLALSVFLDALRPAHLLEEPAFLAGVIALCLVTAMTFLPGFKTLQPWMMTTIPLLDIATIGVFNLIPGVGAGSAVIAVMPAMWLGGNLGRLGILVAAGASTLFVVAPILYLDGFSDQSWSEAVSIILFATIAASAMSLSTQMWAKQVLQLEHQEQSLRRALAVKDDFVALVSHELRTPLTSIIGYLDLVSDSEDDMPAQAATHLEAVSRNADRLLLLVTDLLAAHASEVTPMHLTIESVDVGTLARLSVDDIDTRAREGGLSIERHLPRGIVIQADPNRLLQIIDNLLSNALKFTPPGGHISVAVRPEHTGVALTVTDTGVGMDQSSLQRVGTKFFRSPKTSASAIPGIGLGLTITKSIVEAHHGTLTFASQEGAGTSVVVHLPASPPSASPTNPPVNSVESRIVLPLA